MLSSLQGIQSEQVIVALPGGRSVVGLLRATAQLASPAQRELWKRIHFFIVDERLVPLNHDDSNFRLVNELFFEEALGKGLLVPRQIHPFRYELRAADRGVKAYEAELKRFGGAFHLVVLGVGEDAHVGALFPNHHSIKDESEYFITLDDSPKPPPSRMTATATLIRRSQVAFGLFIGEAKREALTRFRDPALSFQECPAKLLNDIPQSYVITDLN